MDIGMDMNFTSKTKHDAALVRIPYKLHVGKQDIVH